MKMAESYRATNPRSGPKIDQLAERIKTGPDAPDKKKKPASELYSSLMEGGGSRGPSGIMSGLAAMMYPNTAGEGSDEPQHPVRMPDVERDEATAGAPGTEPTDTQIPMRPPGVGGKEIITPQELSKMIPPAPPETALEKAVKNPTDSTGKEISPLEQSINTVTEIDTLVEKTGPKNPQKKLDVETQLTQMKQSLNAAELNDQLTAIDEEEMAALDEQELGPQEGGEKKFGGFMGDAQDWGKQAGQDTSEFMEKLSSFAGDVTSPIGAVLGPLVDFLDDNAHMVPALMGMMTGQGDVGLNTSRRLIQAQAKEDSAAAKKGDKESDFHLAEKLALEDRKSALGTARDTSKIGQTSTAKMAEWDKTTPIEHQNKKSEAAWNKMLDPVHTIETMPDGTKRNTQMERSEYTKQRRAGNKIEEWHPKGADGGSTGDLEKVAGTYKGKDVWEMRNKKTKEMVRREKRFPGDSSGFFQANNKDYDRYIKPSMEKNAKHKKEGRESLASIAQSISNIQSDNVFKQRMAAMGAVKKIEGRMTDADRNYYSNSAGIMEQIDEQMSSWFGNKMPANLKKGVESTLRQLEQIDEYVTNYAAPKAKAEQAFLDLYHKKGEASDKEFKADLYRRYGVDERYSKRPPVLEFTYEGGHSSGREKAEFEKAKKGWFQ